MRFNNPQKAARPGSAAAPRSPTCTCRSGSTATSRCSRRSARCCSSGTPSTTTSSSDHTTGFEEWAAHVRRARLGRRRRATGLDRASRSRRRRGCSRTRRPRSSAGRWASPSTATRSRPSRRSSTSRCCRATSASPAPGCARCAATPTCRATGPWASGSGRRRTSSTRCSEEFGFDPPREHGFDTVEAIQALRDGRAKVFIGMGGNFVSATPDTEVTEAAMRSADLTVHVSTKLNRSHVVTGREALILPALGRSERDLHRRRGSSGSPSRTRCRRCTPRTAR